MSRVAGLNTVYSDPPMAGDPATPIGDALHPTMAETRTKMDCQTLADGRLTRRRCVIRGRHAGEHYSSK
jgi:hypothetical protein